MTAAKQALSYETWGILVVFFLLAAVAYFIRFVDTPSRKIFGAQMFNQVTNRADMPIWENPDFPRQAGLLEIFSINGMLVFDGHFERPLPKTSLVVWVHVGSCRHMGERRYVLPPTSAEASVWWTSLYAFPWERLSGELPLAVSFRDPDGEHAIYYCADILMEQEGEAP